ncbi:hypothetical protein A5893_11865 [Pedobacter psychrophilus]|uniref:Uncharacterized protein n=1 Tax=Pedobacter psychrophilus TaxID=1826909 RepID=A0A179DDG0_9SPHI|nr:hypothetical protein [Pedobacter psychrophilus]OAQ38740.1 hypothetical protein A5893_11865 [Pedobacter psychrophilus]
MAEIKIEKKSPIWPWILIGLIILAIIIYFFVFKDKNNSQVVANNADSTMVDSTNSTMNIDADAVTSYINFINEDRGTMTLSHEYSHEALTKLANATEAMSTKTGVDVKVNLDEVKQLSADITQNPDATNHADMIKKAAGIIASALGTIQKSKFPDLSSDCDDLMKNANEVDGNDLALDQESTIKSFYKDASDVLEKMNKM